jgi:hypothetical protein
MFTVTSISPISSTSWSPVSDSPSLISHSVEEPIDAREALEAILSVDSAMSDVVTADRRYGRRDRRNGGSGRLELRSGAGRNGPVRMALLSKRGHSSS